jgi:hypothetical protein
VQAHLAYIGRHGELGVETDQGQRLAGKDLQKAIVFDWDLDLAAHRTQDARSIRGRRRPSKLVHNIIFSMPPETPADKVKGSASPLQRHWHGKEKLEETRSEVVSGWYAVAQQLREERDYRVGGCGAFLRCTHGSDCDRPGAASGKDSQSRPRSRCGSIGDNSLTVRQSHYCDDWSDSTEMPALSTRSYGTLSASSSASSPSRLFPARGSWTI